VFLAAEQGPAQDIHDKGNAAITYLETENTALRTRLAAAEAKVRELEQQWQKTNSEYERVSKVLCKIQAQLQQAHEREGRLLHAIGEVFRYLNELDKEAPIKPQKHLDLWPWKELNEQAQQAGS
jgi:chromosome segregation ATPase